MIRKQPAPIDFASSLHATSRFLAWSAGLVVCLSIPCTTSTARACAVVERFEGHVSVAGEHALIIWDAETRTEHFIRRAQFHTPDADFGFLVPTPSMPVLAAADSGVFSRLENAVKPATIYRPEVKFSWGLIPWLYGSNPDTIFTNVDSSLPTGSAGGVEVLGEQTVAGYDAAILRANDPKALGDWLAENGYRAPASLNDWVEPYIAKGWIITAFKFSNAGGRNGQYHPRDNAIETQSLRMTFATDRPFYPYREPREQGKNASPDRLLRVYFFGDARFSGELQDGNPWAAKTKYSDKRYDISQVFSGLTGVSLPFEGWLTMFEDQAMTRPPSELFFKPARDKTSVIPPPIVVYRGTMEIPLCLDVVFSIIIARLIVNWLRISPKRSSPPLIRGTN